MGGSKHRADQSGASADVALPPELTLVPGKRTLAEKLPPKRALEASPRTLRFPATEVGAVSAAQSATITNRGATPLALASQVVAHGTEPARPGEFEILDGARSLHPRESLSVAVVFKPSRVAAHIGARMRIGGADGEHVDVNLRGDASAPRAEYAEQRELSVAEHEARALASAGTPDVHHYGGMLAAVLAARTLTQRTGDPEAQAQVQRLLVPVEARLHELNDHQGRLARFGAGNIAGQAALDMAQSAIVAWRQRIALGTIVRADELVIRFRAGAEVIRFLTGEQPDAATLRTFNQVSGLVGAGAAAPVLAPALIALAVEEAALLAFVSRVAARRVAVWALTNPAAALAAAEALAGFGVQIGEDGWESFWDQLRDPQARWFVLVQVLMDFLHVKSSSHSGAGPSRTRTTLGAEPGVDVDAARRQFANARAVVQRVHDEAITTPETSRANASKNGGPDLFSTFEVPTPASEAGGADASRRRVGRVYKDNPQGHVRQREDTWCGAACGEMAARRHGLELDQSTLAGSSYFDKADSLAHYSKAAGFQTENLRDALIAMAPIPGRFWTGGTSPLDMSTPTELRTHLAGYLAASHSSVILRVDLTKHWIIVDAVLANGRIVIRDPAQATSTIVTAEQLSAMRPTGDLVLSYPEKK